MVIEELRRFNRSYTQRIGVLDDSYLQTGRPLGPSRLFFEIALDGSSVLDLRRRLALDSGYVSRMLRQLEADRLVIVAADPVDRRQRVVRLTGRGTAERRELDNRYGALARQLVAPLSTGQRTELTSALDTADRLLRAATVRFDVVDPRSPDARWAIGEYFRRTRPAVPDRLRRRAPRDEDDEAAAFAGPDGGFVVIRTDLEAIGCGGLQTVDDATTEIKRMWIHPDWRGLGLGRRLVDHLELLAAGLGCGGWCSTPTTASPRRSRCTSDGIRADRAIQQQSLCPALVRQAAGLRQPVRNGCAWVTGILTIAVVAPGTESKVISPPWRSTTMRREMSRPSPGALADVLGREERLERALCTSAACRGRCR